MIRSYTKISNQTGPYSKGICKIKIAPKEWLLYPVAIDFTSGIVVTEILLSDGNKFIELEFTPDSYATEEKPKASKAGTYFEVEAGGIVNAITAENYLALETLRHHEFVAIVTTKDGTQKVFGNETNGLRLVYGSKDDDNKQVLSLSLTMENECLAPLYRV